MRPKVHRILRRGLVIWAESNVASAAAAVAFYAVLSLAPTLVFATAAATHWLGKENSRELAVQRVSAWVGPESGDLTRSVLESDWYGGFSKQSNVATWASAVLLLFGASGVFVQLRIALNQVFSHPPAPFRAALRSWAVGRAITTASAIVGGLLLLLSLFASVLLRTATKPLSSTLGVPEWFWKLLSIPASLVMVYAIVFLLFTVLPATRPPRRPRLLGAAVSTVGFELGRWVFGAYVGHSLIASAYGPASSLVAFLLWVFYTTNIVLLGSVVAQAIWEATQPTLQSALAEQQNRAAE